MGHCIQYPNGTHQQPRPTPSLPIRVLSKPELSQAVKQVKVFRKTYSFVSFKNLKAKKGF